MATVVKKTLLHTKLSDGSIVSLHPETEVSQVLGLKEQYYIKKDVDDKINKKQDILTIDQVPTSGSNNPISSDGVAEAIKALATKEDIQNNIVNNVYTKKEIQDKLDTKQDRLTFDSKPTEGSNNPVISGGIYQSLSSKADKSELSNLATKNELNEVKTNYQNKLTFDDEPKEKSTNPVTSDGIYKYIKSNMDLKLNKSDLPKKVSVFENDAGYLTSHQDLSGKQDKLTFDDHPTPDSTNPVSSGGIYQALTYYVDKNYMDAKLKEFANSTDITNKLNNKQDKLTFDDTPTESSKNPVTSEGIKSYVDSTIEANKYHLPIDEAPTSDSKNTVTSGGVYTALESKADKNDFVNYYTKAQSNQMLEAKQNKLIFDVEPKENSINPVTSDGIYKAITQATINSIPQQRLDELWAQEIPNANNIQY